MCSSTWSMQTRSGLTRRSFLSMSMIIRVPLYLSSRCGVWMRISSSVFTARSTCSWKMVASLAVFLFRPISPMPRTLGWSRNSGIMAMTSRERLTFSASLALMHSQE